MTENNIDRIKEELESWSQTFNTQYPVYMNDENKENEETYNYIQSLIKKLSNKNCTQKDYEDIEFHLLQMKGFS